MEAGMSKKGIHHARNGHNVSPLGEASQARNTHDEIENAEGKSMGRRQDVEGNEELPGAGVGNGPCWRVPSDKSAVLCDEARKRCEMLLEQALSCSTYADVRFVFDDGMSLVSGHWGMLGGVCSMFESMYACGMEEARTREVRIVGTSRESFRGFLEWLYLGRAGKEMAGADGREVWLLAERYQMEGVKEWLMGEGLDACGVCAAAQYALEGDGERREELLHVCRAKGGSMDLSSVDEACLRGVSACALREVLEGHRSVGDGALDGERGMERFRLVERWARANGMYGCEGVCDDDHVCRLIDAVDLSRVPSEFISKVVRPSWLVDEVKLEGLGHGGIGDVRMHHIKTFVLPRSDDFGLLQLGVSVWNQGQRLAVCDMIQCKVHVFDIQSGAYVMSVGAEGEGDGQFVQPWGVAFNKQGDLIVSDVERDRIQVFDQQGVHVRSFGRMGHGDGEFDSPRGLAVNDQGDIIVCDGYNFRVQVFREDGTFVRKFGTQGVGAGQFDRPDDVAVGPDGSIVVVERENARVQVFDACGRFVTMIDESQKKGQEMAKVRETESSHDRETESSQDRALVQTKTIGQTKEFAPCAVCVGLRGEIVVSCWGAKDVQVFSRAGHHMQRIGRGGDSICDVTASGGVAVDDRGRLFVASDRADGWGEVAMLWFLV